MERQLLLYLDNCVYSNMLAPSRKWLQRAFVNFGHRVSFSDVHLHEMQNNSDEYAKLLEELDAIFVRNPGESDNRFHPLSSYDLGEPYQRFSEYRDFAPAFSAFEAMLSPLHHMLGGQRDTDLKIIADTTGTRIKSAIEELFSSIEVGRSGAALKEFNAKIDATSDMVRDINPEESWEIFDSQIRSAREGDPMRNMQPVERVNFLLSCLSSQERDELKGLFPEKFAQKKCLEVGDLAGFSLTLFSLGLTKRKGIFSGPRQARKFAAQFRDFLHIEEASRCDIFVTTDQGAFDLSAATFAYAGFSTQSVLLKL